MNKTHSNKNYGKHVQGFNYCSNEENWKDDKADSGGYEKLACVSIQPAKEEQKKNTGQIKKRQQ